MKIYDIDILKKGEDGMYDLNKLTFRYLDPSDLPRYEVQKGEEMRIDLVCNNAYRNTDLIDILCNINNIDNPLNIREGSFLFIPNQLNISELRFDEIASDETLDKLSNPQKSSRKDSDRQSFTDKNKSLPPTIMKKNISPFDIDQQGKIILGTNLF